jgi:hypothetical protein
MISNFILGLQSAILWVNSHMHERVGLKILGTSKDKIIGLDGNKK